jgi:hypothetical protein
MSDTRRPPAAGELGDELETARAQLNRAASELDEFTVARLRAARKRALAAAGARRAVRAGWWLPLTGAALATLVAVGVTTDWWRAPAPAAIAAADDFELLAATEGPEFFDNIDFFHWIGDERDAG